MNIREQLKAARERRALTMEDVGKIVGVSKQTVSTWENGTREPPTDRLLAWAAAVGVHLELRILAEEPEQAPYLTSDQRRVVDSLVSVLPAVDAKTLRMLEAQIAALASDDVKIK